MQSLCTILQVDRRRADRIALWSAGKVWTYAALEDLVARLTAGLRVAGFGPQTLIATLLPNSTEQLALHLAAFRLGAPLVRLNAGYAAPQLEYCLRQTQPLGLVADALLAPVVAQATLPDSVRRVWMVGGPDSNFAELLERPPDKRIDEQPSESMAAITFTSGTMARPKGVVHSRAALGWAIAKSRALLGLGPDDVTPVRMPLYYQVGLLVQSLPTLVACGRVELLRGDSAGVYVEALQRPPAKTVLFDSPAMLLALFRHPELGALDFSRLRWLLSGGDFVPWRLRVMARELLGRDVSAAYGLTEAGLVACQTAGQSPGASGAAETVGPPVPETEIQIAGELERNVPGLEPGQILVRSKSQMSRYWEALELTQSVLDQEGWIATGDVGIRTTAGELILQGRSKHIICRGSRKVSPLEVEAALLMHPGVREAGVTGVSAGEAGERIEAFVILRENFEPIPAENDLRDLARERLATYMVPDRIHFVRRLPMHPTGKLDRERLWMMGEVSEFDESLL